MAMQYRAVRLKVFGGHRKGLRFLERGTGAPTHNAKHIGIKYRNMTNGDVYIATDTAGTWVKENA